MILRGFRVVDARAAWWTTRALLRARRQLRRGGVDALALPPPPTLPRDAQRGMQAVLRRVDQTCLERAAIRQVWHASHGEARDLVIGVTAPSRGFKAHAWLEGDDPGNLEGLQELTRRGLPS